MFLLIAINILTTIIARNKKIPWKLLADTKRKQIEVNLVKWVTEKFEGSNLRW